MMAKQEIENASEKDDRADAAAIAAFTGGALMFGLIWIWGI